MIININALQDGAAEYGGTPSYNDWYQPFNTSNTLLEYTFQPGTYQFRSWIIPMPKSCVRCSPQAN